MLFSLLYQRVEYEQTIRSKATRMRSDKGKGTRLRIMIILFYTRLCKCNVDGKTNTNAMQSLHNNIDFIDLTLATYEWDYSTSNGYFQFRF